MPREYLKKATLTSKSDASETKKIVRGIDRGGNWIHLAPPLRNFDAADLELRREVQREQTRGFGLLDTTVESGQSRSAAVDAAGCHRMAARIERTRAISRMLMNPGTTNRSGS